MRTDGPPNSDMNYGIFNVRTDGNACDCTRGCTDTVRESALKVDSGRKIFCRTGESNLRRQRAGPMLYQLSYLPTRVPATSGAAKQETGDSQRNVGMATTAGG